MSEQDDKAVPPHGARGTVVVLTGIRDNTTTVETRVFESVAAAAAYFAHIAHRAYSLPEDARLEAVAADTAVLFAGYDNTTAADKTSVVLNGVRYEARLTAVLDGVLAAVDGRAEDPGEGA